MCAIFLTSIGTRVIRSGSAERISGAFDPRFLVILGIDLTNWSALSSSHAPSPLYPQLDLAQPSFTKEFLPFWIRRDRNRKICWKFHFHLTHCCAAGRIGSSLAWSAPLSHACSDFRIIFFSIIISLTTKSLSWMQGGFFYVCVWSFFCDTVSTFSWHRTSKSNWPRSGLR